MAETPHSPRFDYVEFTLGSEVERYTHDDFMAMALAKRVRLILVGQPTFFRGSEPVPRAEALSLAS